MWNRFGRPSTRWLVAVLHVAVVGCLVTGGCSSEGDSASSDTEATSESSPEGSPSGSGGNQVAGGPDPCSLLTTSDLESATGLGFGEGATNDTLAAGTALVCDWTTSNSEYQTEEGSIVGMAVGDDFVQVSFIPPGPGNVNEATLKLAETAAAHYGA